MKLLSIIVPCFNEEETIPIFFKQMQVIEHAMTQDLSFEYIFIDDGSKDKTLDILRQLHAN
ncbi:glycosyltransferase, partial [Streptococcus uberis]